MNYRRGMTLPAERVLLSMLAIPMSLAMFGIWVASPARGAGDPRTRQGLA